MSVEAPEATRVDRGQLDALLRLSLSEMLRPGVDPHTRVRSSPLRQVVLSMTMMGTISAMNVTRVADLRSFLVLLFALTLATVVLAVAPESYETRLRRMEVLYSKPISMRTFLVVRTVVLLVLAGLVAAFLALPPLLAAGLRFGGWGAIVPAGLALLLGSFASVVLWLSAFARLAARVSPARLKMVTQTLLALVLLAVVGLTFGALPMRMLGHPAPQPVSLAHVGWVRLLPSTWFVDLVMGGLDAAGLAERVAALGTVALALVVLWVVDVDAVAAAEKLMAPPTLRLQRPVAVRAYERLQRLPWVGPRIWGGPVGALTALVLTVTSRDELTRIKGIAPRLMQLVVFVLAVRAEQPAVFLATLAYVGYVGLVEGLRTLEQSSDAAATWLYHAAPVDGSVILRATRRAALLRHFLFPSLLLVVASALAYPPLVAAVLWLGYLALAQLLVAARLLFLPRLPLAGEPAVTPGVVGFAIATGLGFACLVVYGTFLALVTLLGWIGAVLGAMAAFTLLLAAWVLGHFAGRRLGTLESRH